MRTRQAARGHGVVWAAAFSQSPFRHLRLAASLGREPQPAVLDTPHAGVGWLCWAVVHCRRAPRGDGCVANLTVVRRVGAPTEGHSGARDGRTTNGWAWRELSCNHRSGGTATTHRRHGSDPLPARLRPTAGSDPHLVYQQAKIQSRSPALCQ